VVAITSIPVISKIFFVIAFGLEFVGTWLFLLFLKLSKVMRVNFVITMNARGGPGIVLATKAGCEDFR